MCCIQCVPHRHYCSTVCCNNLTNMDHDNETSYGIVCYMCCCLLSQQKILCFFNTKINHDFLINFMCLIFMKTIMNHHNDHWSSKFCNFFSTFSDWFENKTKQTQNWKKYQIEYLISWLFFGDILLLWWCVFLRSLWFINQIMKHCLTK